MRIRKAVIACAVVALLIAVAGTAYYFYLDKREAEMMSVEVFFVNPSSNRLEPEHKYIPKADSAAVVNRLFDILYQSPSDKRHVRFPLDGIGILDAQFTDMDDRRILELEFSKEYLNLSAIDELFFRAALVWTMTGLDFITDVNISVDGHKLTKSDGTPYGFLNRDNVVVNPVLAPDKREVTELVLYFPDAAMTELYPETRAVSYNPDIGVEFYIVDAIIAGPLDSTLASVIPNDTKIRRVKREGDTCYVNLSAEFINKYGGNVLTQNIAVYSIVNSLTELRNVKRVQFLIEAEKVQDFKGGPDLSNPLERDEGLLKDTAKGM